MNEHEKISVEIIDRSFGMFYGIGQLMPLSSLWNNEFDIPMQCLRFCLRNADKTIQTLKNGKQSDSDFSAIISHISSILDLKEANDTQLDKSSFAYIFFTLLLCRLTKCEVKKYSDWKLTIDNLIQEITICGTFETDMIQWFKEEISKENDNFDITRKCKNISPIVSLVGAIKLINSSWSCEYGRFYIQPIKNLFALNHYDGNHQLLEPSLFIVMLGSIAGALIGRHTLVFCDQGCEVIGPHELHLAIEIGNMITTPGIVPEMNEGFFTNILIVTDNQDDETHDMAIYLALKYPNASIFTLSCQEEPIVLLEKLSGEIVAKSIDLIIGIRRVASVVCQMRETAKILIFPEFQDIWSSDNMTFNEESIFGNMTIKEQGLTYGVLRRLHQSKEDMDSDLYYKYYKSGVRGYESGIVSSKLIDNLNYKIWDLCTTTILPEYKPSPY